MPFSKRSKPLAQGSGKLTTLPHRHLSAVSIVAQQYQMTALLIEDAKTKSVVKLYLVFFTKAGQGRGRGRKTSPVRYWHEALTQGPIGEGSRSVVTNRAVTCPGRRRVPSRPLCSSLPSCKVRAGYLFGVNERSEESLPSFVDGTSRYQALCRRSRHYQLTVGRIRHRSTSWKPSGCKSAHVHRHGLGPAVRSGHW